MSYSNGQNGASHSSPVEHFVSAVTDALMSGETNLNVLVDKYATTLNQDEARQLAGLIQRLYVIVVPVKPSRRFSYHLKQDLMGQPDRTMIERIRYLPPRVQIAAGIAVVAGLMILTRRRLTTDGDAVEPIAIAQ